MSTVFVIEEQVEETSTQIVAITSTLKSAQERAEKVARGDGRYVSEIAWREGSDHDGRPDWSAYRATYRSGRLRFLPEDYLFVSITEHEVSD